MATSGRNRKEDVVADKFEGNTAYDSERKIYTTSLTSSVVNFKYANGRRYHAYNEGSYLYPNDEKESERLDVTHRMIETAMGGKLYFAPIANCSRVLDIGTGTGIWPIEFGEKHPEVAYILGNDLSPTQSRGVPPNVQYEIDNVESDWAYPTKFDFIHCRCMGNAIRDWPRLVNQSFEFLNSGQYAEFVDFDVEYVSPDNTLLPGSDVERLNRLFIEQAHKIGIESCPGKYLDHWMKEAGFEDVNTVKRYLPVGTWPADKHLKEVGAWNFMMVDEHLEGLLNYLYSQVLGMSKEEIDAECARIRKQLRDPEVHCMYTLWISYGRKPESGGG